MIKVVREQECEFKGFHLKAIYERSIPTETLKPQADIPAEMRTVIRRERVGAADEFWDVTTTASHPTFGEKTHHIVCAPKQQAVLPKRPEDRNSEIVGPCAHFAPKADELSR